MNYGQIRQYDVANGPGIRTSIFVTGCKRNCKNCFNTEYMDFKAGSPWTKAETERVISYLQAPQVQGLTILGGEPFENTSGLLALVKEIRQASDKSIWIYSGYSFEDLIGDQEALALLSHCQVLVDGPFVEEKKDLRLKFRGSSNQRLIDLEKSLEAGQALLLDL